MSDAWQVIYEAYHFYRSAVFARIRADLQKFVLVDNWDTQDHLRMSGSPAEFNFESARCDMFLELLPFSLRDVKIKFRSLPKAERHSLNSGPSSLRR